MDGINFLLRLYFRTFFRTFGGFFCETGLARGQRSLVFLIKPVNNVLLRNMIVFIVVNDPPPPIPPPGWCRLDPEPFTGPLSASPSVPHSQLLCSTEFHLTIEIRSL